MGIAKLKFEADRKDRALGLSRSARPRILIVLVQGMGDLVLAIPAIKSIRTHLSPSEITLAAPEHVIDILRNQAIIEHFVPLPQRGDRSTLGFLGKLFATTRSLASRRFEVLINLTTLLSPMTYLRCRIFDGLCQPAKRIGGHLSDCLCWWPYGAPARFRLDSNESQMKFRLMHGLIPTPPDIRPILTTNSDSDSIRSLLAGAAEYRIRIGVCPGGAKATHIWSHEALVECLRRLPDDSDSILVFLGGVNENARITRLIAQLHRPALNCAGLCAIQDLPGLISNLDVLLTNDTGPMHIAAAVGTPVVAIFGPGSPARYGPRIEPGRATVFYRKPRCGPCLLTECKCHTCMDWIQPGAVSDAIESHIHSHRHSTVAPV